MRVELIAYLFAGLRGLPDFIWFRGGLGRTRGLEMQRPTQAASRGAQLRIGRTGLLELAIYLSSGKKE